MLQVQNFAVMRKENWGMIMKKIMVLVITLTLFMTFTACGVTQKVEEKAQEKAVESVIKNVTGGNADVDIEGDKYSFDYGDGNKVEVGANEWPTGESVDKLPKLDKGKIESSVTLGKSCVINIIDLDKKDFEEYFQKVKDAGFTEDAFDICSDENLVQYQAGSKDGKFITISYEVETRALTIMVSSEEE